MENIIAILEGAGITLEETQKETINKKVLENYKTIAEVEKKDAKIASLTDKVNATEQALKKFEGINADALKGEIETLKKSLTDKDAEFQKSLADRDFNDLLKESITEAKGLNAKAITALLDVETLKKSNNQKADIAEAIKKLAEADDSKMLFTESKKTTPIGGIRTHNNNKTDEEYLAENQVVLEDNENYTKFGTYPQSAEGTDKTTIEWLELTREGNKALLISRYGLDVQPFNTTQTDTTWEKCTLRTWLNDAFMSKAFSAEEQKAILHTFIDNGENQGNSKWRTIGGNNTQDRIFLLSYAEADQYFGVTYNENRKSRIAPTAYAIAHGASASTNGYKTNEGKTAGNWWLRSPGLNQNTAVRVYAAGSLSYDNVDNASCCVRPAMWVNLDSEVFRSEN